MLLGTLLGSLYWVITISYLKQIQSNKEEYVKSIVKEMSSTETEWKFCQKHISTGRGRGSSECYAFIWRDSVLELVSDAYIVAQEGGNGSGAEFYFHRPPMLATFRVKPSGMVFTAATIHLTFSGRKEWEPTGEEARILELKNVAAVAARIEDVYVSKRGEIFK